MLRIKPNQPKTNYHVMTRTVQGLFYLDETEYPGFKAKCDVIIRTMAEIYHVDILAWVYMDSHYHMCLTVRKPPVDEDDIRKRFEAYQATLLEPRPWRSWHLAKYHHRFTDLSWFMWEINRRIGVAFNALNETTGHFWGSRFKSKIIEDENSLMRVITYIEQNPVRAGICEKPSDFRWCSVGQAKLDMQKGITGTVPPVGFFKNWEPKIRSEIYVSWMDFQANRILGDPAGIETPPVAIESVCLTNEEVAEWREDFKEKRPSDWRNQGYGSPEFMEAIAQAVKARSIQLAYARFLVSRTSPENAPFKSFAGSINPWYPDSSDQPRPNLRI